MQDDDGEFIGLGAKYENPWDTDDRASLQQLFKGVK
jgi:hypothetical protein